MGVAKLEPLIHASLLQRRTNAEGQPRFALLETLREFALEQLSPERQAALYQAHATYFAVRAEREQAKQHDQAQWFQQVDADIENYRAAADWSLAHDGGKAGARIIAALRMYFSTRGLLEISNQWATLLHDQPEAFDLQPALHACAAHAIGFLRSQHSDTSGRSLALIQRASRLAVEVGDTTTAVQGLIALGMLARYPGNSANVLAALNRARDLAEAIEEPHLLAQVYVQIGMALLEWGRYNDARLAFERVLEYAWLAGLELRALRSLPDLAETYLRQHQHTQAMAHYTHALTWARSVGDREVVAEAEYGLGLLATLAGNLDQADALFTQSLVVYREIGLAYVSRATYVSGYVALVRGQAERAIRKGCGVRLIHFWSRLRPTRLLGWPLSMHGQAVLHRRLRDVVRLMGFASASVAARTSSSQPCEPCLTRHQRYALPTPSLTPQ